MPRPTIEPITAETLPEFARFLAQYMPGRRSAQEWETGLRPPWTQGNANFGYLLRDKGEMVGAIGAFYGERRIRGQSERFCNITSWCVLDAYRQQSVRLVMSLLGQGGMHFTNFSPTKVVGATLKFLKFQELDDRVAVILNLPWPHTGSTRVIAEAAAIEANLEGEMLRAYRDHARLPWLEHVLVGKPGSWCHVIYKRRVFKGLPAAQILHVSDQAILARCFRRLLSHCLWRSMVSTHVEMRLVSDAIPHPFAVRSGFNPKLFLSSGLTASDINYLYSETLALDL